MSGRPIGYRVSASTKAYIGYHQKRINAERRGGYVLPDKGTPERRLYEKLKKVVGARAAAAEMQA